MRIIAGKHRGRKICSLGIEAIRPTTGKAREAIFSILSSGRFADKEKCYINNAVVLDLFAGTGAFSFEALSRGAKSAIIIDEDSGKLLVAKETANKLGEISNITFIKTDIRYLPDAKIKCDLIFIDPPYKTDLALIALKNLQQKGWLNNNAIIVVELDKTQDFEAPPNLALIDQRNYGKSKFIVLEHNLAEVSHV